jgi:hypothetical protein
MVHTITVHVGQHETYLIIPNMYTFFFLIKWLYLRDTKFYDVVNIIVLLTLHTDLNCYTGQMAMFVRLKGLTSLQNMDSASTFLRISWK